MKTLFIALSAFLAFSTATIAQVTEKTSKEETQKAGYVCPMHPHEMSMKEGECGKCGMKLVKITSPKYGSKMKGSPATDKFKYICKMDGTTSDMAGKCSKCGRELVKISRPKYGSKMKGSPASSASESKYVCKMDGSTSNKPGKCPKCGMNMTKMDHDEMEGENHKH